MDYCYYQYFPTVYCYADDTQVYISLCPNARLDQLDAGELLESWITDIRYWMLHDNLKFNDEKTELLIIGTPQQLEKVVITHIRDGNTNIHPVPVARNLDSWLDAILSMIYLQLIIVLSEQHTSDPEASLQ